MTTREQHEQLFKSLDKDGSGTLTQEELIGAIMKRNPKQDEAQLKVILLFLNSSNYSQTYTIVHSLKFRQATISINHQRTFP